MIGGGTDARFAARPTPRWGEFFAPLPLAAVATMVVNDRWWKAANPSVLTGKLSDVMICFFLPLLISELLGISCRMPLRWRLAAGAALAASLFAALEAVPNFARVALAALRVVGPALGIGSSFRMTADMTDLWCLAAVPLAVLYGYRRVMRRATVRTRTGSLSRPVWSPTAVFVRSDRGTRSLKALPSHRPPRRRRS